MDAREWYIFADGHVKVGRTSFLLYGENAARQKLTFEQND
jgi:hypothetical protein